LAARRIVAGFAQTPGKELIAFGMSDRFEPERQNPTHPT
jgi:hypothetical protein